MNIMVTILKGTLGRVALYQGRLHNRLVPISCSLLVTLHIEGHYTFVSYSPLVYNNFLSQLSH